MPFARLLILSIAFLASSSSCLAEEAQVSKRLIKLFSAGTVVAELVVFDGRELDLKADRVVEEKDGSLHASGLVRLELGGNFLFALRGDEVLITKVAVTLDEMKAVRDLEAMAVSDQSIRVRWPKLSTEDLAKMEEIDRANLKRLTEIVERYGWPGVSFAGTRGAQAAFLVLQHTEDLQTQKKYLPLLREAVRNSDASPAELALLEDRVRVRSGLPQLYGSQPGDPIEDEAHVDQRRKAMGLEPLADYLKRFKQ